MLEVKLYNDEITRALQKSTEHTKREVAALE